MSLHSNFGDKIEDYEILHMLGKGGFAIVYKAKCKRTNRVVALKMIDKTLIQYAGLANRVRQEVEIHSRLKHPSVLELYTFFQDAKHVYLVLEWAQNGELSRYIKEKLGRPMTESEAANVLYQVVAGLLYLHSYKIIHRDISLSNLLLTDNMEVKIADFGLATQLKQPNETHTTMCGTPNYISPEVVSRASHGLSADIWSLGCMFYTLLMGRAPFDTNEVQSTLTKVVISNYELPEHLSYEARDLIDRLLRKNPNERIALDAILEHPFMKCYKPYTPVERPLQNTPKYNQSTTSSDSGIVTFASSGAYQQHYSGSNSISHSRGRSPLSRPLGAIDNTKFTCGQQNFNSASEMDYAKHTPANHHDKQWRNDVNALFSEPSESYNFERPQRSELDTPATTTTSGTSFPTTCSYGTTYTPLPREAVKSIQSPACISVMPLNTKRLLPTRYKTKNAIMSILSNGDVVVEFIKFKSKFNEDRIVDICWITSDGQRITIYQPDPGRGLPVCDEPPELRFERNSTFSYYTLPEKHWKKYAYAARFVTLVKRKTPKMTYFSPQAKCHLMESIDDFEMFFYNGDKVLKSAEGVKCYNQHGLLLNDHKELIAASLLDHQRECYENCLTICNTLERIESNGMTCFPLTIGRRPNTGQILQSANRSSQRETISFAKSQDGMEFSSYTVSSGRSEKMDTEDVPPTSSPPIRRTNLEGIGMATELANGIIQVQYHDGSIISVIPESRGDAITYIQTNGISTYYGPQDHLPIVVKDRLQNLPIVKERLRSAPYMDAMRRRPSSTPLHKLPVQKFPQTPMMRPPLGQQQTIKFLR